jgi:uncharacterized protein YegP (UPF0339 family)
MTLEATFQVVELADGAFRWRLRAADGSTLATSDGTHGTKRAAMREVQRLKRTAPDAGVESITVDADAA